MTAVCVTTDHAITLPDGRRLVLREAGDPAGVPVVVHHGTPGNGLLFSPWADDAAARGIRLLAYDRAGYAGSDRCAGRDVAAVASDLAAALDVLGVGAFLTWGASGGGPHALACAAQLPDRVPAAASVAGVAPWGAEGLNFLDGMGADNLEEFGLAVRGEDALRPWLATFRSGLVAASAAELTEQLRTLLSPVDVATLNDEAGQFLHASLTAGLEPGVDGWTDDDLAFVRPWGFDVDQIRVPVLVLQGVEDLMVPPAHGRWLGAHLPTATTWIEPGQGHLSLLLDIGRVHAWLLEHWRD